MSENPDYTESLVGVFGHPVAENPTCVMQQAAFDHLGLRWRYLTIEVLPGNLEAAMQGLRAMGMQGINLTIPYKVEVLRYLDDISPDARIMGAVNTVRREGDRLIGENTDGKGFIRSLREDANYAIDGRQIIVMGAGGAARAMTVELALAGAARILICNRSPARGEELVRLLNAETPAEAFFIPADEPLTIPEGTDVVINATSIGLYPDVTGIPPVNMASITDAHLVCDVIPNPPNTRFLQEAAARGARTLDGLGMLVYQGAIAFELWTGYPAPVDVMKAALEREFGV
ncbi:MAG: shikimate dehydrogenase [Caldilineaceae bacterium]|nr:shikimate dehydrogenase [Caldilineaceae bacterium]